MSNSRTLRLTTTGSPDLHDHTTWRPPGMSAAHVWLCGRCDTELVNNGGHLACEVCGSRYHTETGEFLGDHEGVPD